MAYVAPFRALRYDPQRVTLNRVVTQPYDKITPEMQERYYAASPNNLVRIVLGQRQATDNEQDSVYTRAASFFQEWRRQGVFAQDSQPCLYLYTQRFALPATKSEYERRGFIGLGRLEDYSAGVVLRHEQTLAKPKADRLELLRATRAHFEQLFMLYSDPGGELDRLLTVEGSPDLEVRDEYGVLHRVWRISDPNRIGLVRDQMRDKQLIIADGHHRYETALSYRDERRAAGPALPDDPSELVPMTFVNMDSPGLVILPTHRVVHGLTSFSGAAFRSAVRAYFGVEEVDASVDAARASAILREAGHEGTALLAVLAEAVLLLHSPKAIDSTIFTGLSPRQRSLDVVQLHKCVLERVLGLSEEAIREQRNLAYLRDTDQALLQVRGGSAEVAFLMNPVRMEQVRDIAFAGEVLPQKSTDFYPKLLSGLTIYALE